MFTKEYFSMRLKELRLSKGISSSALCHAIGQSNSYISTIETKGFIPPLPIFCRICKCLNVSLDDFFKGMPKNCEKNVLLKQMIDSLPTKDLSLVENIVRRLLN